MTEPMKTSELSMASPRRSRAGGGEVSEPLPARLTRSEVLELGRFGMTTLWRRIKAGTMPRPIDKAQQALFDRDAVLKALGMVKDDTPAQATDWTVDHDAIRAHRARQIRDRAEARRRDKSRPVRSAKAAPPVRLASDNPTAPRRPSNG